MGNFINSEFVKGVDIKEEQIDELIKTKPKTKEQLLGVRGFGEIKVEKYGHGILKVFNMES